MTFNKIVDIRVEVTRNFPETTPYEKLIQEIIELRARIIRLETNNNNMSWQLNPDRMGGSFSQYELDNNGWN